MKCMKDDRQFLLTKQDIAALVEFASNDKTRDLRFVRFEPSAGTIVATDGHTLVAVKNGGTYERAPFYVAATELELLAKRMKKNDIASVAAASDDPDNFSVIVRPSVGGDSAITVDLKDKPSYPEDWRRCVPEGDEVGRMKRIGLNPDYLARLAVVKKAAMIDCQIRLPDDDMAPILCTFDSTLSECEWSALIMPMRV